MESLAESAVFFVPFCSMFGATYIVLTVAGGMRDVGRLAFDGG